MIATLMACIAVIPCAVGNRRSAGITLTEKANMAPPITPAPMAHVTPTMGLS